MKITIISGSARTDRVSHFVSLEIIDLLEKRGINTFLFDVKKENLPLLGSNDNPPKNQAVIARELQNSDAFIVVSPEYNGSFTGALKNSMDHFYTEYTEKPFATVGVSSGMLGGINVVKQLQSYLLHIGGYVNPKYLLTPNVETLFNPKGELQNQEYKERVNQFLDKMIDFTTKFK